MANYRPWARLNLEGKQEWSDVFQDSKVPMQSIKTQQAKLGNNKGVLEGYA